MTIFLSLKVCYLTPLNAFLDAYYLALMDPLFHRWLIPISTNFLCSDRPEDRQRDSPTLDRGLFF